MDMKSKATFARIIAIQNVQKSTRDERPEKLNVFFSELLREFRKRETTLEVRACGVLLVALTSDSIFYSCDLSYEMRTWKMLLENTFNENKLSFFIAKTSSCYLGINFRLVGRCTVISRSMVRKPSLMRLTVSPIKSLMYWFSFLNRRYEGSHHGYVPFSLHLIVLLGNLISFVKATFATFLLSLRRKADLPLARLTASAAPLSLTWLTNTWRLSMTPT